MSALVLTACAGVEHEAAAVSGDEPRIERGGHHAKIPWRESTSSTPSSTGK
jgi:hypothetical protein